MPSTMPGPHSHAGAEGKHASPSPQTLFIHSTADRAADQLLDTWSFANDTCQEASQGSLTSCSKNRSSRVLSPGLLPAPSNSSLYSCRKALHEDIPCTQAQQHLRFPCVTDTSATLCQVRGQRNQESCPFSEMCNCQRCIIALSHRKRGIRPLYVQTGVFGPHIQAAYQ